MVVGKCGLLARCQRCWQWTGIISLSWLSHMCPPMVLWWSNYACLPHRSACWKSINKPIRNSLKTASFTVCATCSISLVQRQNWLDLDPCQKLNFPITGFSLSLPAPGFKSHYRSSCHLTSLKHMMNNFAQHQELTWRWFCLDRYVYRFIILALFVP